MIEQSIRDEIATVIRDNISVTLHNTGDEYTYWEITNYDAVVDRILAIPRLQEALSRSEAQDTINDVCAKINRVGGYSTPNLGHSISTNTKG